MGRPKCEHFTGAKKKGRPASLPWTTRNKREVLNVPFLLGDWPQRNSMLGHSGYVLQGESSVCPSSSEVDSLLPPLCGHG